MVKCFQELSDSELSLLIVCQVKGSANDSLDILETNDEEPSSTWKLLTSTQ